MDRIVFYNGEETGYVVERTNFNNSFFAEQYASALKLFKNIYCSKGPVSNIIAFCGDRGEGKTSCMRSFINFSVRILSWITLIRICLLMPQK